MSNTDTLPAVTATETQVANWIAPMNIQQGLQLADMMAKAKLIPEHLRGDPGSCLLVLEQASRWRMSPFAVAQCTAVVRGKLCFEGKLVAAVLAASGAIVGRLSYEFSGDGPKRSIKVTGLQRGEKKPVSIVGTVENWLTRDKDGKVNQAWQRDPDSMLIYRGTRQWARIYAPEAMLGVYTSDEVEHETLDAGSIDVTVATPKPAEVKPPVEKTEPANPTNDETPAAEKKSPETKPGSHPALNAARSLFKTLGNGRGKAVMDRLSALYGAKTPSAIATDRLADFGEDVDFLAANLDQIDATLDRWENKGSEGQPSTDNAQEQGQ